jgi:hypothetical protein
MESNDKRDSKQSDRTNNRAEQRHQKESQVAQLSAANVEESPHMDRGDSEGGAGQSLPAGQTQRAGAEHKRGAVDTQYGTKSGAQSATDRSGGDGSDGAAAQTSNPGPAEQSSGSERDTMSGPRPGSGS